LSSVLRFFFAMVSMLGSLLVLTTCVAVIHGHGYLLEPVARSSAWLIDASFRQCCTYSNHMEMFCGGLQHQWNNQGGKCSICGEAYDKPNKLFDKGGAMYRGTSVRTYTQGQQIDVKVVLTANHKGYFEFRLCNLDGSSSDATQDCLDRGILKIANTDSTKFRDIDKYGSEAITVRVQLPSNVACRHCVFQWRYTTGNNWGTDPVTGQSGIGFGIENETFMGCSDITIVANGAPTNPPPVVIEPTPPAPQTTTRKPEPTTTRKPDHTTSRPSGGSTTWSSNGVQYKVGDEVMYDGVKYRCVHDHTSYPGAEPGIFTWAWWQRI
jgi:hypothetical protein